MPRRPLAVLIPLVLAGAPQLSAQSSVVAGPRQDVARAGVAASSVAPAPLAVPRLQPPAMRKRGVPQMVIGGVAIIGGAVIGDDVGTIVSLGGLGYGLYGLYLYLN